MEPHVTRMERKLCFRNWFPECYNQQCDSLWGEERQPGIPPWPCRSREGSVSWQTACLQTRRPSRPVLVLKYGGEHRQSKEMQWLRWLGQAGGSSPVACQAQEMREELRKMKRKVSGTKAELQKRLEEVFETNDRGWLTRGAPALSKGAYLESGTFRDVYMVTYTKGPRKNMKGVYKVFKDQKAEVLIQEDLKAVEEAGRIIKAFNEYNDQCIGSSARRRVYLNQPEVWSLNGRPILVEPFIDGTYAKFNSNSGWVNEGYNMMQALSHFSFHVSNGQHLLCDLQGGGYDTHYILTDPAVLSLKQEFGATDGGKRMMKNFFAHHLCNEYCDPSWLCMERPKVVAPARSGTSFFPKAQRSTAMDAFRNAKFNRW
ncbi:Alpha-protein kinase vwkA (von Willebrand factor A alpha-kinase) (vWF kinase) [Durusdinium trenchii]|uniref:Alpha-protein kinase vwkA (von Willebrand factor A alpha-kinase) (vWF kinase) n=1 Tax=Durusdinium trenchii TaxID=1381693 RepID=A0ABP0HFL2_9DINO